MPEMQIYLARNNQQAGPYSLEQVNTMLASQEVLLDDLIWHAGMEKWKTVGEITAGNFFYDPNSVHLTNAKHNDEENDSTAILVDVKKGGMTQNREYQQDNQEKKRLTVDQLYGREPLPEDTKKSTVDEKASVSADEKKKIEHIIRVQLPELIGEADTLATASNRILAVLIDQIILMLAVLPLLMRTGLDKFSEAMSLAQTQKLIESIPPHIAMMTSFFILAVLVVQMFLLVRRGQTIGKLITGVRILDFSTKKLPSVTNVLLIRTIVFNIAYSLPLVGLPILVVDFISMLLDRFNRSLHDKLAKTIVVKAKPEQLETQRINKNDK